MNVMMAISTSPSMDAKARELHASKIPCMMMHYLDCMCSSAAINGSCDQDSGQCYCSDGVMGLTCNDCLPYNQLVGGSGCQPCDQCVLNLTDANSLLKSQLNDILSDAKMATDLRNADTLSIDDVNATIEMQMVLYDNILANITDISENIGDVANSSAMVIVMLENQQQEVTKSKKTRKGDENLYRLLV